MLCLTTLFQIQGAWPFDMWEYPVSWHFFRHVIVSNLAGLGSMYTLGPGSVARLKSATPSVPKTSGDAELRVRQRLCADGIRITIFCNIWL